MLKFVALIPVIIVLALLFVTVAALKIYFKGVRAGLTRDLDDIEKTADVFKAREQGLDDELRRLDTEVSEIAGLYEITKAMSMSLFLEEIFAIFSEFLKKNFSFSSCTLILKNRPKGKQTPPDRTYKIEGALPVRQEVVNKEIPLVSHDNIIGTLSVEGVNKASLEKFMIVARQFALEIEKAWLYETIQALAITDGLTGLFVRRHFIDKAKEELERSSRNYFKMSFLMVDLDHFKELNDKFGHLMGDAILRDVARVLKQNVREVDLAGRYGGEEFLFLLPETDKADAAVAAERLRAAVAAQEFMAYDELIRSTISVGISTFPDDSKKIGELVECADKALYKAKADGRNRVAVYSPA